MRDGITGSPFVRPGGELRLSNSGQLELLRGLAERGKTLRTRVLGSSMSPFIQSGDILTISPPGGRPPRIGDVFAFTRSDSGRLVIHRIIARRGAGWILQGDNSRISDGIIRNDQLIGRVTTVERRGRPVRFGLERGRRIVPWLVRLKILPVFQAIVRFLRRRAVLFLRRLQNHGLYRSAARRLLKGAFIIEATGGDTAAIRNSAGPDIPDPVPSGVTVFTARRPGRLLGTARLVRVPESDRPITGFWLFSLTVRTRYRGMGVGETLVRQVLRRSASEGATRLSVSVLEDDIRAFRFCGKLGFTPAVFPAPETRPEYGETPDGRRRVVLCRQWAADRSP
jgi:signal peptidase I